jgi:hypothetical protein
MEKTLNERETLQPSKIKRREEEEQNLHDGLVMVRRRAQRWLLSSSKEQGLPLLLSPKLQSEGLGNKDAPSFSKLSSLEEVSGQNGDGEQRREEVEGLSSKN